MGDERTDRRAAPRAAYSVTAVVYLGKERYTARVLNLSGTGLLLIPPVDAELGTHIHLNLTLPGLDQIIDADGVIAREETVEGYLAWGIKLHEPSPETRVLLKAYVDWACQRQAPEAAPPMPVRDRVPLAIERTKTGPAHQLLLGPDGSVRVTGPPPTRVKTGVGLSPVPTDPSLSPTPIELEEPDLLAELRKRYRETLEQLRAKEGQAGGEKRKSKKRWFR